MENCRAVGGGTSIYKQLSVLGLDTEASGSEIRKAYHKLALKYHPDKNHSPSAEAKFRKIKVAYEKLNESEHSSGSSEDDEEGKLMRFLPCNNEVDVSAIFSSYI
jgi:DnaJ-class molecular chaperone